MFVLAKMIKRILLVGAAAAAAVVAAPSLAFADCHSTRFPSGSENTYSGASLGYTAWNNSTRVVSLRATATNISGGTCITDDFDWATSSGHFDARIVRECVNGITYSASATENNLGGRVLLGIQKAGACYGRENTQEGCFTSPTSTAGCTITTMPYQLVTTGTARWWLHNPIGQYYYNDGGAPYNP